MRRSGLDSVGSGAACLVLAALAVAGCGGGAHFADKPRPADPINLSVYVNPARVSVSPSSVGAGPISFIVTNATSIAETVTVSKVGSSGSAANTGPINPGTSAQVQADLGTGEYTIASSPSRGRDAALASSAPIRPALLRIAASRHSSNDTILQP